MPRFSAIFALSWLTLAAPAPAARASGFTTNDLYLLSPALPTGTSSYAGIVRIDPASGAITPFVTIPPTSAVLPSLTYDPRRDMLVYATTATYGGLTGVDASGATTSLAPTVPSPALVAARGDGIIYMWVLSSHTFRYLDAAGVDHDLLDPSGAAAFTFGPNSRPKEMIFDPTTNSLIVFDSTGSMIPQCPDPGKSCAIKLPLSADGGQVVGPVTSVQVFISGSGSMPEGSGLADGGGILWENDTNSNNAEPRFQLLDPVAMATSTYATPDYVGSAALNGGTYSHALGEAVGVDTGSDSLLAFHYGVVGRGVELAYPISTAGGSGEVTRIVEIRPSPLTSSVGQAPAPGARDWALTPAGGNPFHGATRLAFEAPVAARVAVAIHDVRGRRIALLASAMFAAGHHELAWDGRDAGGKPVPPGIYFARLESGDTSLVRKLVLER